MIIVKEYAENETYWTISLEDGESLYKVKFIRNTCQAIGNFNKNIVGSFYLMDGDEEILLSSKKEFLFTECGISILGEVKFKFVEVEGQTSGKEISLIAELKKG